MRRVANLATTFSSLDELHALAGRPRRMEIDLGNFGAGKGIVHVVQWKGPNSYATGGSSITLPPGVDSDLAKAFGTTFYDNSGTTLYHLSPTPSTDAVIVLDASGTEIVNGTDLSVIDAPIQVFEPAPDQMVVAGVDSDLRVFGIELAVQSDVTRDADSYWNARVRFRRGGQDGDYEEIGDALTTQRTSWLAEQRYTIHDRAEHGFARLAAGDDIAVTLEPTGEPGALFGARLGILYTERR